MKPSTKKIDSFSPLKQPIYENDKNWNFSHQMKDPQGQYSSGLVDYSDC